MDKVYWVLSSSFLILAVMALRGQFRKSLSPGIRCAMWGLVLARLLFPGAVFQFVRNPAPPGGLAEAGNMLEAAYPDVFLRDMPELQARREPEYRA